MRQTSDKTVTFFNWQTNVARYNTFMQTNVSQQTGASITEVFKILGQPVRLQILLILNTGEECVCHIEAVLGIRQASISQQLMVLRDAGLVISNRDGRNIFYRLANPALYNAILAITSAAGISLEEISLLVSKPVPNCPCPHCNLGQGSAISC